MGGCYVAVDGSLLAVVGGFRLRFRGRSVHSGLGKFPAWRCRDGFDWPAFEHHGLLQVQQKQLEIRCSFSFPCFADKFSFPNM